MLADNYYSQGFIVLGKVFSIFLNSNIEEKQMDKGERRLVFGGRESSKKKNTKFQFGEFLSISASKPIVMYFNLKKRKEKKVMKILKF